MALLGSPCTSSSPEVETAAQLSHMCPQEPAPHTGAVHCHPSAVWSLGGQRGSARGFLSFSKPNYPSVLGTPGPSRQCQHKLTHTPPKALWVPPPSLPESGRLPHSYPPRVSEKGFSSNNILYRHMLHLWGRREVGVSPAPQSCTKFDRFLLRVNFALLKLLLCISTR